MSVTSRTAIQTPGAMPVRPASSPDETISSRESPVRIGVTGGSAKSVGHTLETIVFTVAVQILLAVGPAALIWWVIQAWSRSNVLLLDFFTAVAVASSAGAWMRVLRPEAPIRRFPIVPVAVQNSARQLIERSAFGVGRLNDWTWVEADHGLSLIRQPSSMDELRNSGLLELERLWAAQAPCARPRPRGRRRAADSDEVTWRQRNPLDTGRSSTWWHVASPSGPSPNNVSATADGGTRSAISTQRARSPPGVVLSERDAPQVGHRILVPDTSPTNS